MPTTVSLIERPNLKDLPPAASPISDPDVDDDRQTLAQDRSSDVKDDCDRRRPEEEDHPRNLRMSPQLLGKTVTPFLKDHIPGIYAPMAKLRHDDLSEPYSSADSKFCYRHRPDSKCRRAADESKMVTIQRELDKLPSADQQAITHVWSLFSAAPSKHRNLMIQGIMTQCCFPQLSTVAREVQEQLKIDFITALPVEISYKILAYLDTFSLCKASQVSKQWRELADADDVWRNMCMQHIDRKCTKCGWGLPLLERKRLRDWTRQQELSKRQQQTNPRPRMPLQAPMLPAPNTPRSPKRDASDDNEDYNEAKRRCIRAGEEEKPVSASFAHVAVEPFRKSRAWKQVYRDRFKIGFNWRYGRCSLRILKGEHTNGITCLQLLGETNTLATGSYDSTIKIWDTNTGSVIRTLRGHTRGVRTLQYDNKILVSGSLDHTVKIWNWRTGECINTLQPHHDGVISVHFEGEWLATGSMDKSIKVFNMRSRELFCLKGHHDWVNQVRICTASRVLFSASDDCRVKLWDLDSKQCIRTFEGHLGHVQQVLLMPPDFEPDDSLLPGAAPDNSDAMSTYSGRGGTPALTCTTRPTPQHTSSTESVSSTQSATIPYDAIDVRAGYGYGFVNDPDRPLPSRYMMTGGLDSTARLWDTATGKCLKTLFGHLEGLWALAGDTLRVVSGSNDGMTKVWDPRSGRCERTFVGHRGPVTCVGLSDDVMASGSEDGEVRLYSFQDTDGMEEYGTPS